MEHLIIRAINNKRIVEFHYQGRPRVAEPHVYGITNGVNQLLAYQTEGQSKQGKLPGWRRFNLSNITSLTVLEEAFPGPRPNTSGLHSHFDQRIAFVN